MINAVLVFNNSGQPRLTKFYTQLVRPSSSSPTTTRQEKRTNIRTTGNKRPTTPHLRNLHPRLQPLSRFLQLPAPPSPALLAINTLPLSQHQLPYRRRTSAFKRRPLSNNLPPLCNPLFHHHQHIHRIPARAHRFDTSIRRS